jgi:predicted ATPase
MSLTVARVGVSGYRSLRRIHFPVARLSVFVGGNGAGKTNLYRSLQLLQAAAAGTLARELAAEGGMASALWAGPRRKNEPARISLSVGLAPAEHGGGDANYRVEAGLVPQYSVEAGVRAPTAAGFLLEPQIKSETLTMTGGRRPLLVLSRDGPSGTAMDEAGEKQALPYGLLPSETALGALRDAARFPDIDLVRRTMLDWRFYHAFRTDRDSELRRPALAVTTPTLSSDGSDLAAVFATLAHIRQDTSDLDGAVEDAFPGAQLVVPEPERTASFGMIFPEHPRRVFDAGELSDGTVRYLALAGALLSYRLPSFIALNEPETSLHPDLLPALARMILRASERTQVWLVTHSQPLAEALAVQSGVRPRTVVKRDAETWIEGLRTIGDFGAEYDDEEDD